MANITQEHGETRDFYRKVIDSEVFYLVSYLDIRDSSFTYIKIKSEQEWKVQYCSEAYFKMVR